MSKAIKLKNDTYLDISSIVYNKNNLKTILDKISKTSNGYCTLANGIILQWGKYNTGSFADAEKTFIIPFPILFPNICLNVQPTLSDVGYGGGFLSTGIGIYSVVNSQFGVDIKSNKVYYSGAINLDIYWIAIGF